MRSARLVACVLVALAMAVVAAPAQAVRLAPVGVFAQPVYVAAAPGDHERLFVVERGGTVRIVKNGIPLPVPFLDITTSVSQAGEGGLLSIGFPPDWAESKKLYVYFTPQSDLIEVAEFRISAGDPDRADAASRRTVITIPHPDFQNHYGGQVQFGPDGLMYLAPGDGGSADDPFDRAQDLSDLLGKMLRIDPAPSGAQSYTVPSDNPFVATPEARPEIWSYGLRNPFRFSFDRATGDLTIGDVGQNLWEEVDFVPAADGGGKGANFGWSIWEGRHPFKEGEAPGHVPPVLEYPHGPECSVIGGYVVHDPALPELAGDYVYSDLCTGEIRAAHLEVPDATDDRSLGLAVPVIVSFGEDAGGCVYAVSLLGLVFRLAPDVGVPIGPCLNLPEATGSG